MKSSTKLLSLLMAGVLTLGLAGCSGADTSWSVEYDGQKLPTGVYVFNLLDAYSVAASQTENPSASPLGQKVDGTDAAQWIEEKAKEYTNEYIAVERKAAEMGLTLGEAENEYISYLLEQQWTYMEEVYTANGIAKDSVQLALENAMKRSLIFGAIYGEGGTEPVPAEEIAKYYEENFARVQYIALSKKDNSGAALDEEAMEKNRAEMQGYVARAKAGEKFEDIIQDYRVAHTPEGQEVPTGGYESVVDKENVNYPQTFRDQLFAMPLSTPTDFEDDNYFYLLVRTELQGDEGADLAARQNSILTALKQEEFTQRLSQWTAEVSDVTYNADTLKKFSPKNVKLG